MQTTTTSEQTFTVTHHFSNPRNNQRVESIGREEAMEELAKFEGEGTSKMLDAAGNCVAFRDHSEKSITTM